MHDDVIRYGPWTRFDNAVMNPSGINGTWDKLFATNPAAYIYPNGSALLIYKGGRAPGYEGMYEGVAWAQHYLGPYVLVFSTHLPVCLPVLVHAPTPHHTHLAAVLRRCPALLPCCLLGMLLASWWLCCHFLIVFCCACGYVTACCLR